MKKILFYTILFAGLGMALPVEAKPGKGNGGGNSGGGDPAPTAGTGVDAPDPDNAIKVDLFGIKLEDDIYLDGNNILYNDHMAAFDVSFKTKSCFYRTCARKPLV